MNIQTKYQLRKPKNNKKRKRSQNISSNGDNPSNDELSYKSIAASSKGDYENEENDEINE